MRRLPVVVSVAALSLLAACSSTAGSSNGSAGSSPLPRASSSTGQAIRPSSSGGDSCTVSDRLVPSCGVIWGISTQPATLQGVAAVESLVGRNFDMIYRYHDIAQTIPDEVEQQAVAEGRILHLSIAAREYADKKLVVTYKDIAAGKYDKSISAQGRGIASLKVPVFVTFEQEANQHRKLDVRGDATQFKAAWRHIREVQIAAGATNAVWTWVMTGAPENLDRAGSLWPGNDAVDWISWNVYNASGCNSGQVKPEKYKTFADALAPFYDWVHSKGPGLGIDPNKPMMISESGSVMYNGDLAKTADWYSQVPQVLQKYPQIKAFTLWASRTSPACNYEFQKQPSVAAAVAKSAKMAPFTDRLALAKSSG